MNQQPSVFSVFSVSDMTLLKTNKSNDTTRKKRRNHVRQACLPCRKAHTACDETKPCGRCVKQQRPELCVQSVEEYSELGEEEPQTPKKLKKEDSDIESQTPNNFMTTGPPSSNTLTPLLPNQSSPFPNISHYPTNNTSILPSHQILNTNPHPIHNPRPIVPLPISKNIPTTSPELSPLLTLSGEALTSTPIENIQIQGNPIYTPPDINASNDPNNYTSTLNIYNLLVLTHQKMDTFITDLNRMRIELITTKQQQDRMMDFFSNVSQTNVIHVTQSDPSSTTRRPRDIGMGYSHV
jgi:hypothetical protein